MTAQGVRRGFSLIEVLVALSVFAIAAVALLQASAAGVRAAGLMEDRALALVVAENVAAEIRLAPTRLPLGLSEGEERLADRDWRWRRVTEETENPAFRQITIGVSRDGDRQELATLIFFRRVPS